MAEFIFFDRQSDALASLEEFASCIDRTSQNLFAWKYAIVAIHNALQGYMCICLANGNGFQTWSERDFKKWLEAYRSDTVLPDTKLDFFMELYDKAFAGNESLNREHIRWLNDTRNSLIHFNTDSFGVHHESAIICSREALEAIKLCPSKAGGIFFYSEEQSNSFQQPIQNAENVLSAST